MKDYKKIICLTAAVCLLGAAAFCGYHIFDHYAHEAEQTEAFEEIAAIVEQAQTEDSNAPEVPLTEEENVLAEYSELFLKNTDMVGWLSIAGTTVNYPVMQTPNAPNYYLKRNFEKEYSDLGTPYIQENCDLASSDNLVIYGHHIKGGRCLELWRITNPRASMRNTRPFSLIPLRSVANMRLSLSLRLWRTALRASATMILSMRKTRTSLTPIFKNARSLHCMKQA